MTPHTLRRTYITYMLAAGHDIPYVQSQVGHLDPTVTLAVYAQLIRRSDREQLRAELRGFLDSPLVEVDADVAVQPPTAQINPVRTQSTARINDLRTLQKAGKGRAIDL